MAGAPIMAGRDCSGLERRYTAWHGLVRRGEAVKAGNGATASGVAWPSRRFETRLGKAGLGLASLSRRDATCHGQAPHVGAGRGRTGLSLLGRVGCVVAGLGWAWRGSQGELRFGLAWPDGAVTAWRVGASRGGTGLSRHGRSRRVVVRLSRRDPSWSGLARSGGTRLSRPVFTWQGEAWRGATRLCCRGNAWRAEARLVMARPGWRGCPGAAGHGLSGLGPAQCGNARPALAVRACPGGFRLGWAWLLMAVLVRQGRAQRGWARPGRHGAARRGRPGIAGRAMAWQAMARLGRRGVAMPGKPGPGMSGPSSPGMSGPGATRLRLVTAGRRGGASRPSNPLLHPQTHMSEAADG